MKKNKGFTLIELMIVVAIIGILSAIAIPKFADLIRKSNEGATRGNLGAVRSAISIYYGEQEGMYPASAATLAATLTMDNGKYIKELPLAYAPNMHAKNGTVTAYLSTGGDTGGWGYEETNPPTGNKQWGDFWVDCSHTDTKNVGWDAY